MTLDLDRFLAQINEGDVARRNLFKVEFDNYDGEVSLNPSEPTTFESLQNQAVDLVKSNSAAARKLSGVYSPSLIRALGGEDLIKQLRVNPETRDLILGFYVQQVSAPESVLTVEESRSDRLSYQVPVSSEYGTLTITFIMTPEQLQRQYFLDWQDKIYDVQSLSVGFYDDYTSNISIKTFDRSGTLTTITEYEKCFPINVSALDYDYTADSDLLTFSVEFQFRKFIQKALPENSVENEFNNAKDLFTNARTILNQF